MKGAARKLVRASRRRPRLAFRGPKAFGARPCDASCGERPFGSTPRDAPSGSKPFGSTSGDASEGSRALRSTSGDASDGQNAFGTTPRDASDGQKPFGSTSRDAWGRINASDPLRAMPRAASDLAAPYASSPASPPPGWAPWPSTLGSVERGEWSMKHRARRRKACVFALEATQDARVSGPVRPSREPGLHAETAGSSMPGVVCHAHCQVPEVVGMDAATRQPGGPPRSVRGALG